MYDYLIDLVKEEMSGIKEYSKRIAECKDEKLKALLVKIRTDEKTHAAALLGWMSEYINVI